MSHTRSFLLASSALLVLTVAMPVHAQDAAPANDDTLIVTGTRDKLRTRFTTLTPVDVLSAKDVQDGASSQLTDQLAQVIPSFNVQKLPTSDGLQFIRPAHLRGLSSDQTLVLINGKRFHRTAFLGQRGAQGPDLAQIPNFAVGRVEVLRDGASAQYGSDAIAGVINIKLNTAPGIALYTQGSQYFAGDGATFQVGARFGCKLGDGGHVVVTAEAARQNMTSRSHQRPDAIAFQTANPTLNLPNPVQNWGKPDLNTRHFAVDAAVPVAIGELYAFSTFSSGDGINDINWRIADATANAAVYKTVPSIFPGWDLKSVYPAGFTPREAVDYKDYQSVAGLRGHLGDTFDWDLSLSSGQNETKFFLHDSINASMGPASPEDFFLGTQRQNEFNLNADAVYHLDAGLAEPINIAFGAERRVETYTVKQGDEASYLVGPGAPAGLAAGSNGFPGFSPQQSGKWDQTSNAVYIDTEAKITDKWSVGGALRYEDYSEFGNTTTGKVDTRFEFTPDLAIRGSYSTGFRAPTPGQLNSLSTSQGLDTTTLQLFTTGRLSPTNPIAVISGAKPLEPETSKSYNVGFVWRAGSSFSGSIDAYQVEVDKRFSISPNHTLTTAEKNTLTSQGVAGAANFTSVNWFTNDFDTQTQGVDLVVGYNHSLAGGRLDLKLAYNHNETKVKSGSLNANATQKRLYEESLPKDNLTASATYTLGAFDFQTRARYYGSWTDSTGNATGDIFQTFGSVTFFDASVTYNINPKLSLKVAGENIFDTYPDKAVFQASRGIDYSRNSPYDTDGGQYFVRLNAKF